jgi:hypothetical protein
MSIVAVTTFHKVGLELYGRRMMSSFLQRWPVEVSLYAYCEGWSHVDIPEVLDIAANAPQAPQFYINPLLASSDWLAAFQQRNAARNVSTGFRKDAIRFSHKIAALLHAIETSDAKYIIWVDGDVYTHSPFPLDRLRSFFPENNQWISYLDRGAIYPECGFYIINVRSSYHADAVRRLRAMYADDLLFMLPEWHDSYVLWKVIEKSGAEWRSLSGEFSKFHHPFVNVFGGWMDHLKGDRKRHKRSLASDLKTARNEPYWRGRVQR